MMKMKSTNLCGSTIVDDNYLKIMKCLINNRMYNVFLCCIRE